MEQFKNNPHNLLNIKYLAFHKNSKSKQESNLKGYFHLGIPVKESDFGACGQRDEGLMISSKIKLNYLRFKLFPLKILTFEIFI